jgi:hypothetical protein
MRINRAEKCSQRVSGQLKMRLRGVARVRILLFSQAEQVSNWRKTLINKKNSYPHVLKSKCVFLANVFENRRCPPYRACTKQKVLIKFALSGVKRLRAPGQRVG